MSEQNKQSGLLGPLLLILCLVLAVIWLSSGSSNQARQHNWVSGWKAIEPFQLARRAPAAVTYNGYIYVVGGIDANDRYVHPVEYAPILEDGSLGEWQQTSPIIEGRFYNATIAHAGFIYNLGGGSGDTGKQNYPISSIERARINPDGSLGPWQTISHMLSPRRGLKAVLHDNTIYAIGGYDGRFLKSIERTTIQNDGSLSNWQMEQHESIIDRYIHSAAIAGDRLFLLGGHMRNTNQASYSDVESSQVSSNKQLSPWQIEKHGLQTPRLVAESFTLGQYLYIAGGHTGNQRLNSVEMAKIDRTGQLQQWRFTSPLTIARSAYAAATANNFVYLLGGAGDGQPLRSVDMASANLRGQLGYQQ